MRIGSLCSGAGGLDLAVAMVFDAETVWHCENDPAASRVLEHRWPGVHNHGDLIATDWGTVEPVDIVAAGWPCQPFSVAGKRKGHEDERAIWPHIARAVRLVRPRYVVLENVAAVLAVGEFQRVASDLAALRYDISWMCLRASDVGAPHRRERIFILACLADSGGDRRGGDTQLDGEPVTDSQTGESGRHIDRRDVETCTHPACDGRHEGRAEPARLIGGSDAAGSGDGYVAVLPTPRTSDSNGAGIHGDGGMDLRSTIALLSSAPRKPGGDGGKWGKYGAPINGWERLTRLAPPPAEPNRNGKPRLNPAFSEWMMGWPDGWVTKIPEITRNQALRLIGNGVVPQCAAAALLALMQARQRAGLP